MLKDIEELKVERVGIAVIYELDKEGNQNWTSYLLNMKNEPIEGVLVTSSGYGEVKGKKVKTSDLRYFLDVVPAQSFRRVEIIPDDLLGLNNQYWVSFRHDGKLFDKKFIFVPESINSRHLVELPLLEDKGILIS